MVLRNAPTLGVSWLCCVVLCVVVFGIEVCVAGTCRSSVHTAPAHIRCRLSGWMAVLVSFGAVSSGNGCSGGACGQYVSVQLASKAGCMVGSVLALGGAGSVRWINGAVAVCLFGLQGERMILGKILCTVNACVQDQAACLLAAQRHLQAGCGSVAGEVSSEPTCTCAEHSGALLFLMAAACGRKFCLPMTFLCRMHVPIVRRLCT